METANQSVDRNRTKMCPTCQKQFTYQIGRGTDRRHCSEACVNENRRISREAMASSAPPCVNPECTRRSRTQRPSLCQACYFQQRRTGSLERIAPPLWRTTTEGYVVRYEKRHPLANKQGCVYQHRQVLFDAIGVGPHPCHWCGLTLSWTDMVVDHLNEVKYDNRLENLVPSCQPCNAARSAVQPMLMRMTDAGFEQFVKMASAAREFIAAGGKVREKKTRKRPERSWRLKKDRERTEVTQEWQTEIGVVGVYQKAAHCP